MEQSQFGLEKIDVEQVARVPNLFLLDNSASMRGDPIDELNRGLEYFTEEIGENQQAEWAVDVSIVAFGKNGVSIEQDFRPLSEAWMDENDDPDTPSLEAGGTTPMCEAIREGLQHLEDYKGAVDNRGLGRKRALVWLLTDGAPNNSPGSDKWNKAQNLIEKGTKGTDDENPHLFFYAVGIGDDARMDTLDELVSAGEEESVMSFKLGENKFQEFFEIASKSATGSAEGEAATAEDAVEGEPDDPGQV